MESINLSGNNYPIRFDFRALKEYKSISKNDALTGFQNNTENIVTLTYCALKSGHMFKDKRNDFTLTEEQVSEILGVRDMFKVVDAFMKEVGIDLNKSDNEHAEAPKEGEASGIA
jgi:hypothetical protein